MVNGRSINNAVVRILSPDNTPVGAGFMISETHLMTCAHNLEGLDKKAISVDFPMLGNRRSYKAAVDKEFAPDDQAGAGDIEDIAVLKLSTKGAPPANAVPVYLSGTAMEKLYDQKVKMFGFPEKKDAGKWVNYILRDRIGTGWVQMDPETEDRNIECGFSGTAVWEIKTNAVVGMVVSIDTGGDATSAYIIPAERLVEAWPDLKRSGVAAHGRKMRSGRLVPKMCDRGIQDVGFWKFFEEKSRNCPNQPQMYVMHGRYRN